MFRAQRGFHKLVAVGVACSLLLVSAALGQAQPGANVTDPVGNEWPVVGGNLGNGRYSSLDQINTSNVTGSQGRVDDPPRLGPRAPALRPTRSRPRRSSRTASCTSPRAPTTCTRSTPKTGAEHLGVPLRPRRRASTPSAAAGITAAWRWPTGSSTSGRLDGAFMALDAKTGHLEWQTQVGRWQDGYTITAAPLVLQRRDLYGHLRWRVRRARQADGARRRHRSGALALLDDSRPRRHRRRHLAVAQRSRSRQGARRTCTAAPPSGSNPTIDPSLGMLYFSTGNAGPDYDGSPRPGDNLFTVSIVALHLDGTYAWHFQQVHHDIWDFDSPSPDRPVRHDRQRPARQGHRRGQQDRLDLHARPHQRQADRRHGREARPADRQPGQRGDPAVPGRATR